jgi:hypothetical protein
MLDFGGLERQRLLQPMEEYDDRDLDVRISRVLPEGTVARYEYDFGVTGHRNCSDNFVEALQPWGIQRHQLPHPVNLFQNMSYPEGQVKFGESLARPGDAVELRALLDVIAAVSACPMDLNPISGFRVSDLALEIE